MFKIVAYGVRPNEVEFFNAGNKYHYDLKLVEDLLTHENAETAKGEDAVLLRANCVADETNIAKFHEWGIKYLFTRTVAFNHIDLKAAAKYDMKVARVPSYSPNAVAELALTLGMTLLRHTAYATSRTAFKNFKIDPIMFSKEIRNCTVGIIGTGRIGLTEAKLYQGLGAKVIGYDIFQSAAAKKVVTFTKTQAELLQQSDIVSLHVPFIAGENDQLIDAAFLKEMKPDGILINTSRGELQDNEAILAAVQQNKLGGFAADVLPHESEIFFHEFKPWQTFPDKTTQALIDLYPKVLITPHIGSNTDEALRNMIETSFDNFNASLTTGKTPNDVELPAV